jgi:hypothetical protein
MEPINALTSGFFLDAQSFTLSPAHQPGPEQAGSMDDRIALSQEGIDAYAAARKAKDRHAAVSAWSASSAASTTTAQSTVRTTSPVEAYTNSGHKVTVSIETYLNDDGYEKNKALVRLDSNDGQSRVFELEESMSMVITEDESGNLIGYGAKDGILIGTSGKDIIISAGDASVYAGDGDDAIFILRDANLYSAPHGIAVDAGNGNDTLIADKLVLSNINMGDGDDTLKADFVMQSQKDAAIDMGKGNDAVHINRLYGRVSLGEGDDVLVAGLSGGIISGGDGNDILNLGDFSEGDIIAGAGNDVINAKSMGVVYGLIHKARLPSYLRYDPRVTIDGGSGATEINVEEELKDAFVDGGSGKTTLNARNVVSSFFHNIQANIYGEIASSLMSNTVKLISGQEDIYKNADEKLIKKMYDFAQQRGLERYLPTDIKV